MILELPLRTGVLRCDRTLIMGVLNVTPDSFSDGGRYPDIESAVERGRQMAEQGADLIDIGGESTRPGAAAVGVEEELGRVAPVVERLAPLGIPISVDTRKPPVAAAVLEAGAALINDVSGLSDEMLKTVASAGAAGVAMHMRGEPRTMQQAPSYDDVVSEVADFLAGRRDVARSFGVPVVLDPGIGFGKTLAHNLELLRNLDRFVALGAPVLIGVSRKSFLGKLTGADVDEREEASIAANCAAILSGVHIVRVHDVVGAVRAARTADALRRAGVTEDGAIAIRGLRCTAEVGVGAMERSAQQGLEVDVRLLLPLERASRSDELADTIDYARVCEVIRRELAREPAKLLEVLAARVATRVLEQFSRVLEVEVALGKPLIAEQLDAAAVTVRIRRRR